MPSAATNRGATASHLLSCLRGVVRESRTPGLKPANGLRMSPLLASGLSIKSEFCEAYFRRGTDRRSEPCASGSSLRPCGASFGAPANVAKSCYVCHRAQISPVGYRAASNPGAGDGCQILFRRPPKLRVFLHGGLVPKSATMKMAHGLSGGK